MSSNQKFVLILVAIIVLFFIKLASYMQKPPPEPVFKDAIAERIYAVSKVSSYAGDAKLVVREIMKENCPCLDTTVDEEE